MKELFREFRTRINEAALVEKVEELCRIERDQTFTAYHRSVDHICNLLRAAGIPNVEKHCFPADGETAYEDKRMPLAWDVSTGKLTLCDDAHTVAADYQVHPFHLIKGSTATRQGGETVRIITEQQFLAGESPDNALVVLETGTWPRADVLTPILDQGGRGIISDFLEGRYEHPDAIQWVTACTEGSQWHVTRDDRDFIGFSVSLRMGARIRELANQSELKAVIECDGRRYAGQLPAATALIPGRRKEEIWLMAHTFEPLLDDDSTGVIAGIEVAKLIMAKGTPEYSLRLIFAMEFYGFAAFHANFKGKVIGGANMDSLPARKIDYCKMTPPIASVPFHGVELFKQMAAEFKDILPCVLAAPECFDDMSLSDSTTGVPTVWFLKRLDESKYVKLWHNSAQTAKGFLDPETLANFTAMAAVWFFKTLFYTGAPAQLSKLELKPISSPWRDYAAQQIYARAQTGLPYDLTRIPKNQRRPLPDLVIYGPMGSLLSGMDGRKNLAQIILETEADRGITLTEAEIKKYIDSINYLTDWGYLKAVKRTALTQEMLTAALAELGVVPGDVLLVHASVSNCGYVKDGAETLIRGIMEATGEEGGALFPTFTRPYIYLGENLNKSWSYRPFDAGDLSQIWTGTVPKTVLEKFPDAVRSRHITHSWAGLGIKAQKCVKAHGPTDPPTSLKSPLGKALEMNGKVLYLGTGLEPSIFLHLIETVIHAAYLQSAVCRVKNPDGTLRTVLIEDHLPGHRDFYRKDAEHSKFFQCAVPEGLKIAEKSFGMGKLQLIELREFYEIGMKLLQKDPRILLCDDPDCWFCRKF